MTNEVTNLGAAGRSTGAISVVGILQQNEDSIVRIIDSIAAPNRARMYRAMRNVPDAGTARDSTR